MIIQNTKLVIALAVLGLQGFKYGKPLPFRCSIRPEPAAVMSQSVNGLVETSTRNLVL